MKSSTNPRSSIINEMAIAESSSMSQKANPSNNDEVVITGQSSVSSHEVNMPALNETIEENRANESTEENKENTANKLNAGNGVQGENTAVVDSYTDTSKIDSHSGTSKVDLYTNTSNPPNPKSTDSLNLTSHTDMLNFDSVLKMERKIYRILEPGEYKFTVKRVVKKIYEPKAGSKLSRCWMAELTLAVDGGARGRNDVLYRLYWHPSTVWRIAQLWKAVGLAKTGETFRADADQLVGRSGICSLEKKSYQRKDGTTALYNEVRGCYGFRR